MAGGFNCWSEAVCRLRELLLPNGWNRTSMRGLPLAVSPDNARAIVVITSGSAETGTELVAQTSYVRGEMTTLIVQVNCQLDLFPGMSSPTPTASDVSPFEAYETWVLLIYRDAEIVRAELSLPSELDCYNRIVGWLERIPLGEHDMGALLPEAPDGPPPDDIPPDGDSFDVPVEPTNL
jgi:hypothetical protein